MVQNSSIKAEREQVLAFRLQRHNLASRLPEGALLVAAAAGCGIRNTPPGSAELAFQARVNNFSLSQLESALTKDKTLLEAWSIRGSPFLHPVEDISVFTQGTLPAGETALRVYLKTSLPEIEQSGKSAIEVLEMVAAALLEVLDGRSLPKGQLSTEVSYRMPKELLPWCKGCQAYHVNESLFRLAAQKAQICFDRSTSDLLFVRSEQWLGAPLPEIEPNTARTEVLRRYLGCFGPSTPAHFANWAGISPAQAKQTWQTLENELVEVTFDKAKSWLLRSDLEAFEKATPPENVRLLPPYDHFLTLSDRATLIPEKSLHSEIWRILGNPGVVMVEGEAAGTWRSQKKGKQLTITANLFGPIPSHIRDEIEAEAKPIAPIKGCTSLEVKIEG